MDKYYIKQIGDGWAVVDPNDNIYTSKLLPEDEAQKICDNQNANYSSDNDIIGNLFERIT